MTLVFITGISTSGKSTICKELAARGYKAHDTERGGISAWFDISTGERVAEFGQVPERTKEWMDQHEWRISIQWVKDVAANAQAELVFLCGGGSNEGEVRDMCQIVIWLQTDEATIRNRVRLPRDHTYGTKPHELLAAIEANARKGAEYQQYGAVTIDARRSVGEVTEEIIELVRAKP